MALDAAGAGAVVTRLAQLPGVPDAVARAREACTELRWHPALRRRTEEARAEAGIRAARCSAALDGARLPVAVVRDAARGAAVLPDDAAGRVVGGAVRVQTSAREVETLLAPVPAQALARLHVAAAAGWLPDDELGRPRTGDRQPGDGVGDPSSAPTGTALAERLTGVRQLLAVPGPALVVAALLHAELLTARPFAAANGLVARAAARAVIVARGLDPTGVVVWEAGHLAAGPAYQQAVMGYAAGDPGLVGRWLVHCAEAVVAGAAEGRSVCDAVLAGRLT